MEVLSQLAGKLFRIESRVPTLLLGPDAAALSCMPPQGLLNQIAIFVELGCFWILRILMLPTSYWIRGQLVHSSNEFRLNAVWH